MVPSSSLAATLPNLDSADRILRAAETLFAKHGFGAVSMSAIARRAGVSKANVFHHFATKQALYLAVLTAACRAIVRSTCGNFLRAASPPCRSTVACRVCFCMSCWKTQPAAARNWPARR